MEEISKKLSCGVLVFCNGKVLIQHVTGQHHWDIPKGTQQQGETPSETAVRELFEETGISLKESDMIDLGWFEYNRYKDLFLFASHVDDLNLDSLVCNSTFEDGNGITLIEADEYRLVSPELLGDFVCGSMRRLLDLYLLNQIKKEIQNK